MIATEGINDGTHRRVFPLADEIKIHHPLHGTLLHAIDDARSLRAKSRCNSPSSYFSTSIGMLHHLPLVFVRALGWLKPATCLDRSGSRSGSRISTQIRLRQNICKTQRHWDHCADVRLRAVHPDRQTELLTSTLDQTQSLLIIWASTTNPNLNAVGQDLLLKRFQCLDQTSKRRSNISEICDATPNDQYLAVRMFVLAHET
mmetsp:Transcript_13146/g.29198  ORF Transcript_13146/g.29198 Transcript_13146/m.29198 type:complete len:202 (+) Transcript_13146:2106-2711(+)